MFFHRHHYTTFEKWMKRTEALWVGVGIILFWRGLWNLCDIYIYPTHETISALISLLVGIIILLLTKNLIRQFLGEKHNIEN